MNLILCGFQGAGKTTCGRKLAERVGAPFVDTDELIVARLGMSCREIVELEGEPFFRAIEKVVVKSLVGMRGCVIALGGGTLMDGENRAVVLGLGRLVYLVAGREEVKKWSEERKAVFESLDAVRWDRKNLSELEALWREVTLEHSLKS